MEAETSSRDLLQRFAGGSGPCDRPPCAGGGDVELSLSLGGCFSSNPRENAGKLVRSSSISSFPFLEYCKDDSFPVAAPAPLHRTCSLPVPGTDHEEEDHKKRKEMQMLKRLEAKRKRSEKRNREEGGGCPRPPPAPVASQGSAGSFSSSSGGGGSAAQEAKSSLLDHAVQKALAEENTLRKRGRSSSINPAMQRPPTEESTLKKKIERRHSGMGEMDGEMPCVSTRGNGPNGKRIEGFLYKYRRGEEVRIVCVCHGSFLTPAEFVRHSGGGDVDHPLRHIVVSPCSSFL